MLMLLAIFATVFNLVILIIKYKRKRYQDAFLDTSLLILVFWVLKGSEMMLLIGIFSSLFISIYLWFSPPNFIGSK
jgi:hypothetical protein